MKRLGIGALGLVFSSIGCGNDTADVTRAADEKVFPYVDENGVTVCSENVLVTADGNSLVQREMYDFDSMNEALAGRGSLDAGLLLAMKEASLERVTTCEDAHRFGEIQRAYVEARPLAHASDPTTADEPLPGTVIRVADGVNNDLASVVRIQGSFGGCSGVLISPKAVLTAAHCFGFTGTPQRRFVRVDHGRGPTGAPNASIGCISLPSTSCALTNTTTNATVHIFPGFNIGVFDTGRDLAIVVMDSPWADPNIAKMRISVGANGAGQSYVVNGYGAHADNGSGLGIHRNALAVQGVDTTFTGYWRDKVQSGVGRPCEGDSGSPAINRTLLAGQTHVVIGIASNVDGVADGTFCPEPGDFFRYTRVDDKISFIKSTVGTCSTLSSNGWPVLQCF